MRTKVVSSGGDAGDRGAKKTILARRARFVAAAMASVGIACGKTSSNPEPCLSVVQLDDGGVRPTVCLSVAMPRDADADPSADASAGADASAKADAGAKAGTDAGAHARAGTTVDAGRVAPKPRLNPLVCLSVLEPGPKEPL